MTEDEKIRMIIAKYQNFFESADSDVGHAKKGVWFFMRMIIIPVFSDLRQQRNWSSL